MGSSAFDIIKNNSQSLEEDPIIDTVELDTIEYPQVEVLSKTKEDISLKYSAAKSVLSDLGINGYVETLLNSICNGTPTSYEIKQAKSKLDVVSKAVNIYRMAAEAATKDPGVNINIGNNEDGSSADFTSVDFNINLTTKDGK